VLPDAGLPDKSKRTVPERLLDQYSRKAMTESLKDKTKYDTLKIGYDSFSKRINKFTQWVENNLN
jgi:hypothetical protein